MEILKSHLFPFSVVGTRAIVIFLIPSRQTEVVAVFFNFPASPPAAPNLATKLPST